ncbi:MAG: 2OG-Fe(II) oxygenase [Ferruginibacter sp.]
MKNLQSKLGAVNWQESSVQMNEKGYAILSGLLSNEQCEELIQNYDNTDLYRKTIVMERYRFGQGEYKYFKYPLPVLIQYIREQLYPHLADIANGWMNLLNIDKLFPNTFPGLQMLCHTNNQKQPTVLILKYGKGGHNTLHQDLYGEIFFPIQLVLFLNEAGKDFTGGEFVLTQQTPRAQSKAIVLNPKKGDMLMFTTNFRPVKGSKRYYRANMKHGVSELQAGQRHTLGIIFHDALT